VVETARRGIAANPRGTRNRIRSIQSPGQRLSYRKDRREYQVR
jgi:hypothetical protein